jgi:hypothetical protein
VPGSTKTGKANEFFEPGQSDAVVHSFQEIDALFALAIAVLKAHVAVIEFRPMGSAPHPDRDPLPSSTRTSIACAAERFAVFTIFHAKGLSCTPVL